MKRNPFLTFLALSLLALTVSFQTNAQVTADFTANTTSGCSPLIVNFENLSTGSGLSYEWNLGNGNTSVQESPSASYVNPGTYTVTLTATGPGGSDTETKTGFITVFTPPAPDLSASQTIGCFPFTVTFTDESIAGDSPIATWSWDFGDGSTSTAQSPSHTYTTPGVFDVTLLLTDQNGCASNVSVNDLIESNSNRPEAIFSSDINVGCLPPVDVSFTNNSTGGTGVLTYEWEFGDGNASTIPAPDHTYQNAGEFDISLTVTDELGCSDTLTEPAFVIITDSVDIDFEATQTTVCLGESANFSDLSSPAPSEWLWDFGDGNTSTDQNPDHLYTTPGTYEVSLTATYSASCGGTETKTAYITVGSIPFADFTPDITASCQNPTDIAFTNNSVGNGPLTYEWNFGDGNTSSDTDPTHTYQDFGTYTVSLTATNDLGCSSTLTQDDLIVISETTADFLPDVFGFCQPLEVNFTDTSVSASDIVSWEWDFGDGNTSTDQNPTHVYGDTGIYDVSLTITNQLGCTDTLERSNYIFVYTPPVADFVQNDTVICPGELEFTDLSSNATDWFWDFGDGNTSTDQNPTNEFQDTGFFNITLITLNNGCSDTLIVEDLVYVSPPIADLTSNFDCANPNTWVFENLSVGETSWEWNLPDGGTSTSDPLSYTFPAAGEYVMRITAFNDTSGCVDSAGDTIIVANINADFAAANTEDCAPLNVEFTDQSTDAAAWFWDFGDGNTSTDQNPTHVYDEIATYSVSLVAEDANGCTDTVLSPDLVTVTGSVVDLGIDTTFGCETLSVQFEDLTEPPGTVTDWLWDFGDGNTSTAQNPLHVYNDAGTYDVSLTITDVGGCTNTILVEDAVEYIPFPVPGFSVDDTLGCIGEPFSFTNTSTGDAVSYQWNFGDGTTTTDPNPVHSYSSEGTYSVTLTAFNDRGCDSSVTEVNLINIEQPDADFSAFPTFAFCPPLLVSFTDLSSSDAVSWFWDFGNGSTSNLQNPSHIYTESGSFTVTLIVTNANGCTDTIVSPDLVELSGPSGDFSFFPDTVGCPPYEITFTSNTENANSYTWDFGDGFLGSGATSTHSYEQVGSYIPTLILEDNNGCTFTYQSPDTLRIEPLPVDAGPSFSICQFESVQLSGSGGDTYTWSPTTGLSDPSAPNPTATPDATTTYTVTAQVGSCFGTDTVTVNVNPAPLAGFDASEVCQNNTTLFTDLSTVSAPDSIISWSWDLATATSSDQNPELTYAAAGSYEVTLEVESASGCSNSITDTVVVNPLPDAAFIWNDTCLFETTFFSDASTVSNDVITSWEWDFGNGASSTGQNTNVTYGSDTTYEVNLMVTTENGCTDTATESVVVFPLPVAAATADNVCFGEPVSFGDSSSIEPGSIVEWSWTFGDDEGSTEQHPEHSYGNDQAYVYSLTVTSDNGCTDALSGAVTVHPIPESTFEMGDTSSCFAPVTVQLTNQSSGANQFDWEFGNGNTSNTFNATANYDTIGQYSVQLTVTNQFGCQDSSTQLFEVFPTVVADFETSDPDGCEPWTVQFTNLSENGIDYSWDFSDAPGSSNTDPEHIFQEPGIYSVELIIEGLGGCSDTVIRPGLVSVFENPTASFDYQNISQDGIANGTVAFYNTSTPHVSNTWDFGNGDTSNNFNTTYNYPSFGNRPVYLSVIDANGCVDTILRYISVDYFGGLYVPNAVIPTNDNLDVRVFQPTGTGLATYRCMVFDKWGNKLWESTKLENGTPVEGWDATYRGELVPQGAYVWKIDAIFGNGEIWEGMEDNNGEFHQTGTVTVIR